MESENAVSQRASDIPDGDARSPGSGLRSSSLASASDSVPYVPDQSQFARKRHYGSDFYFGLTILSGVAAIAIEKMAHLLAQVYADPLPHYGYLAAYLVAVLSPIYVRWALAQADPASPTKLDPRRVLPILSVAFALNTFSLVMAAMMGIALLPITPIAVIGIGFFGLGLTGLSPYLLLGLSISQAMRLRATLYNNALSLPFSAWLASIATGIATLLALFIHPFLSGSLLASALRPNQSPDEERRTADLLHQYGGDNAVLVQCYSTPLPLWEWAGYFFAGGKTPQHWYDLFDHVNSGDSKQARRLYFLMTGQSYTHAPVPWTISNNRSEQWINDIAAEDVGGTRVGRHAEGISLASKSGTAVLDASNATAECDFTLRFANSTDTENEARAEILLPPGAVCHHASLWINNTERPAAFGPQATVRRAYESVAVVQRRDPLLVTMPVPGKLLVQCFPVPAKGTMQIRLGITFPMFPDSSDRRKLSYALPAWGDTNFTGAGSLANALRVTDVATGKAPVLPLSLPSGTAWSERAAARKPVHLVVVTDGSNGMNAAFAGKELDALAAAADTLPTGSTVDYMDAHGRTGGSIRSLIHFRAGQDNVPGLMRAVKALDKNTTLLYLHAGTPDSVSDPAPLAEAVKALPSEERPRFVSLLLALGAPDVIGDRLAMQRNARTENVASYPDGAAAITATVENIVRGGVTPEAVRSQNSAFANEEARSLSRQRIAAYQNALSVWYVHNNFGPEALAAAKAAARLRLVTPLSGAVVLETKEDYKRNGLDDGTDKKESEDSLVAPEPGTCVLLVCGAIGAALFWWRRKGIRAARI